MIERDKMDQVGLADAAMVGLYKRREAMQKRIEGLEKAISEGQQQLEESKDDLNSVSLGLFYVMSRCLVELADFTANNVTGFHKDVLWAVQTHNDTHHRPMTLQELRIAIRDHGQTAEFVNGVALMEAVTDLIDVHLLVRGGPDHETSLQGNFWTSVTDLRASIDHLTRDLRAVLDQGVTLPANVTQLWPRKGGGGGQL